MWGISLLLKLFLGTPFAYAVVTPTQLYEMVNSLVDLYMKETCVVVISSGGYVAGNSVAAVYVNPYHRETRAVHNANFTSEESYKKLTLAPVLELGCTGFVIQVENPGVQFELVEKTFVHVNQRTQRMFIFLPMSFAIGKGVLGSCKELLGSKNFDHRSILGKKSVQYVTDLILAVPNDTNDRVDLLTHRFSGIGDMGSREVIVDTYIVGERRFELGANIFPDKIKDLEGKVLKVAAFHYPPYAVVIEENNRSTRIDGTEWRFAIEFARLHNGSVQAVIDSEGLWGDIFENLTGNGVTGNLVMDRADIGLAALYSWHHESLYLDLTAPFYRSGITSLVPGPRQISKWKSPILPFSPGLWTVFIAMTLVSVIFTGIVNRAETRIHNDDDSVRMSSSKIALTVLGITILQGLSENPKYPSWAALSATLLVYSVLITTAYGSSLATVMTLPRFEPPINTASELAASGIPWAGTHNAWIFSIRNAEERDMQTLVRNFRVLRGEEISKEAEKNSWGFSIERLQGGFYAIQDYLSSDAVERMHLMKSDIYWEYCVSMLRKSSPYTRWYSKRILEIQSTGIPQFWEFVVASRYMDKRTQMVVRYGVTRSTGPIKITTDEIQGTFYILLIGLLGSGVVFLGELFIDATYRNKLKNFC